MSNNQPKFTRVEIRTDVTPGRHTYWNRLRKSDGLLFQAVDDQMPNPETLIRDPVVQRALGGIYVIGTTDKGLTLHNDLVAVPTPDKATKDDAVHYVAEGGLKSLPILQRFRQCMEPARDLLGCEECPSKGLPCLSGEVHGSPIPELSGTSEQLFDGDALKDNKTIVAGFRYVSPVLLADESETFVKGNRAPDDIEWEVEEARRAARSAASAQGALTRRFRKTECDVCIAQAGGCEAWRNCSGAYPPAEEHQTAVLTEWLPILEATPARNGLQLWQMYAIMRLGGTGGDRAWNRRRVVLGGLCKHDQALAVRIAATACPSDEVHAVTTDWKRLREVFPELPESETSPLAQRPSDFDMALYFGALGKGRFRPVSRGFNGSQSDPIAHLSILRSGGVWVERARRWGIRLGTHGYQGKDITDWSKFYEVFGSLPAKRRRTRPEVWSYD